MWAHGQHFEFCAAWRIKTRTDVGAGDGTRTRNDQLGRLVRYHCATPACFKQLRFNLRLQIASGAETSVTNLVQGVGFEPTYGVSRPGLQPGAINHSTPPARR